MTRALCLFLGGVVGLAGCESAEYARAVRTDTIASYRRFVARYPEGERADQARRKIERAVFRRARRIDRPLAYRLYLQRFPRGRFADRALARMARLALQRAETAADLQLVIERFAETPEGRSAEAKLATVMADEALRSPDASRLAGFLRRFPSHERAAEVREQLARRRLARLPADTEALERFLDRFKGTTAAVEAQRRLARRMVELIETTHDPLLLDQFAIRFPRHGQLDRLRRLLLRRQTIRVLGVLDLEAVGQLAAEPSRPAGIAQLERYCRAHRRRCEVAQRLARQAAPWQPEARIDSLQRDLQDTDPAVAWRAMASLSCLREARAAEHLADQLRSARVDTLWAAQRALGRWLGRMPADRAERWLRQMTRHAPHRANPDDVQRHAFLLMLAQRAEGQSLLRELMHRGKRALAASYLLACNRRDVSKAVFARLVSAMTARLRWLEGAFPSPLDSASVAPALLAEREAYAIGQVIDQLAGSHAATSLVLLKRRCRSLLGRWREQLRSVKPDFAAASTVDFSSQAKAHEDGRPAAWQRLARRGDPPSKAAAAMICLELKSASNADRTAAALRGRCERLLQRQKRMVGSLLPRPSPTSQGSSK